MSRWTTHIRNRLVAGFFFLLPSLVTLYLIVALFRVVDRALTRQALDLLEAGEQPPPEMVWGTRVTAVLVVLLALYVVGAIATNVVGRRLLSAGEGAITHVPVVGGIYRGFRQMLDAFGGPTGRSAFRRCVLIEYPRAGAWRLAFVTNDRARPIGIDVPCISVFVPMTPNPTSGFLVLVPPDQCRPLAVTVEEGLKMIVSGGMVMPEHLIRPSAPAEAKEGPR